MDLKELHNHLQKHTAKELFGKAGKEHPNYKKWAKICHPDLNADNADLAKECFQLLNNLTDVKVGVITITHKGNTYSILQDKIASTPIADIFLSDDSTYRVKVARTDSFGAMMQKEESIMKVFDKYQKGGLYEFTDHIRDSFTLVIKNYPKRHMQVREGYSEDFATISEIMKDFPDGVGPRSFVWIFKRLLLSLALVHDNGYVYGGVNPDTIILHKVDHICKLTEFIHTVNVNNPVANLLKDKRFYAPEVLQKKNADFSADVFAIAKLGVYTLGGNVDTFSLPNHIPDKIGGFLKVCAANNKAVRPDNVMNLLDDFTLLSKRIFGKSKYVQLGE